jgi:hypothetical protein
MVFHVEEKLRNRSPEESIIDAALFDFALLVSSTLFSSIPAIYPFQLMIGMQNNIYTSSSFPLSTPMKVSSGIKRVLHVGLIYPVLPPVDYIPKQP